ncbi:hypothetical protein PTTG_30870, partial [Puccinia triticina 1-1 BBBD Race 1]
MADNKPPSGRFIPRSSNLSGPIPGLRTIDRNTPKNPTMRSVLGPQLASNDYFRRRLNRIPSETSRQEGPSTYFGLDKGKNRAQSDSDEAPAETTFQPRITGRTIGSSAANWRRTEPAPHLDDSKTNRMNVPTSPGHQPAVSSSDIANLVNEMRLQREAEQARREEDRARRTAEEARSHARWELDEDSKISAIVTAAIKDFA